MKELEQILGDVFDRRARGQPVDAGEYVARHPELATELRESFAALEQLDQIINQQGPGPRQEECIGDYRLRESIGSGGMGVVFLADQLTQDRTVALKVLPAPLAQKYGNVERFRREAEIARRLRHPNLVAVYEEGLSRGYHYFAMEYVPGVSLAQMITHLRTLPVDGIGHIDLKSIVAEIAPPDDDAEAATLAPRSGDYYCQVARILADLADGLAFAHQQGVVHRDIKPQNILIDRTLRPQLADFGLARDQGLQSLSCTGDLIGTPYYMSPEVVQLGSTKVDHRTDIYSLGVTLFELLTLRLPFPGPSTHQLLQRIIHEPPPAPTRLQPGIPRPLEVIALKAMEKNPAARYANVAAMATDLRRFLRGDAIAARPPSVLERARRGVRRHQRASVAVSILGAASVLVGAILWNTESRIAQARLRDLTGPGSNPIVARDQIAELIKGGNQDPALRERLAALTKTCRDLREQALRQGEEYVRQQDFARAEMAFGRALAIENDRQTRERHWHAANIIPLSLTTEGAGARFTFVRLDTPTGRPAAEQPPIDRDEDRWLVPAGEYFIVAENADGLAEVYRRFHRGLADADRSIAIHIVPTTTARTGMAFVPGGRYRVGRDAATRHPTDTGRAATEVEIGPFLIDVTEVSNKAYAAFIAATGHRSPRHWVSGQVPEGADNLPVAGVAWHDAMAYAEWIGKRLPTDLEWEIAGRGQDGRRYPWGNDNVAGNANLPAQLPGVEPRSIGPGDWSPVAVDASTADRSPFGVLHLAGNVQEWVFTPFVDHRLPPQELQMEPGMREIRGGKFAPSCDLTTRGSGTPGGRQLQLGFRCARTFRP